MKTPTAKWISTYQCQDCGRLVQVQYSCGRDQKRHKAKAMRSLDITEGNCRGCGEQLTANTIHYSGHREFFDRLQNKLDEINLSLCSVEKLRSEVAELYGFVQSTYAWKNYEIERYKADES